MISFGDLLIMVMLFASISALIAAALYLFMERYAKISIEWNKRILSAVEEIRETLKPKRPSIADQVGYYVDQIIQIRDHLERLRAKG